MSIKEFLINETQRLKESTDVAKMKPVTHVIDDNVGLFVMHESDDDGRFLFIEIVCRLEDDSFYSEVHESLNLDIDKKFSEAIDLIEHIEKSVSDLQKEFDTLELRKGEND